MVWSRILMAIILSSMLQAISLAYSFPCEVQAIGSMAEVRCDDSIKVALVSMDNSIPKRMTGDMHQEFFLQRGTHSLDLTVFDNRLKRYEQSYTLQISMPGMHECVGGEYRLADCYAGKCWSAEKCLADGRFHRIGG